MTGESMCGAADHLKSYRDGRTIPSDGNDFLCANCWTPRNSNDDNDEHDDLNAPTRDVICCKKCIIVFDTYDDRDEHKKVNPAYCPEHDVCFPKDEQREHANRHPYHLCFLMNCECSYDEDSNEDGTVFDTD